MGSIETGARQESLALREQRTSGRAAARRSPRHTTQERYKFACARFSSALRLSLRSRPRSLPPPRPTPRPPTPRRRHRQQGRDHGPVPGMNDKVFQTIAMAPASRSPASMFTGDHYHRRGLLDAPFRTTSAARSSPARSRSTRSTTARPTDQHLHPRRRRARASSPSPTPTAPARPAVSELSPPSAPDMAP